jgi:hypothetical protein
MIFEPCVFQLLCCFDPAAICCQALSGSYFLPLVIGGPQKTRMAKLSSCCGLCPALALTLLLCAVSTDPPPNSRALRGEAQKQQPSPQWNQKRAEGLAAHGVCNMGAWNQNDLAKYGLAVQGGGGGDQAYYMNGVHRNVANLTSYEAMGYQSCGTPGAPACEKCNAQPWPSNRSRTLRKEVRTLSRAELQAFVRSLVHQRSCFMFYV